MSSKRHVFVRSSRLMVSIVAVLLLSACQHSQVAVPEPAQAGMPEKHKSVALGKKAQQGLPEAIVEMAGKQYRVEVASSQEQIQIGLMYRQSLPNDHGMLFEFKPARVVYFWMKNTYIPLDMVFVANGHVTHVEQRVPPCKAEPCPVYGPGLPTEWVVELPAGTAARDGLVPLTSVRLLPVGPVITAPALPVSSSKE